MEKVRYASSGVFDGRHKYCRYYGIGGGVSNLGVSLGDSMLFGPDADFDDHDHEWYDHDDRPARAGEPGQRPQSARRAAGAVEMLKELEAAEYRA